MNVETVQEYFVGEIEWLLDKIEGIDDGGLDDFDAIDLHEQVKLHLGDCDTRQLEDVRDQLQTLAQKLEDHQEFRESGAAETMAEIIQAATPEPADENDAQQVIQQVIAETPVLEKVGEAIN